MELPFILGGFVSKAWSRSIASYSRSMELYDLRVKDGLQPSTPYINLFDVAVQNNFLCLANSLYLIVTMCLFFYMKKRASGFRLRWILVIYDAINVILGFYVAVSTLNYKFQHGWMLLCNPIVNDEEGYRIARVFLLFYLQKYFEFFDTWFFILRKSSRQVTFLHLFHHSSITIVVGTILPFDYNGDMYLPILLNSTNHMLVYLHYLLATLGVTSWWSSYITSLQLIQFILIFLQSLLSYHKGPTCGSPDFAKVLMIVYMGSMVALFSNFFLQKYILRRPLQFVDTLGVIKRPTPTMMTTNQYYHGNGILDAKGEVTITLPQSFPDPNSTIRGRNHCSTSHCHPQLQSQTHSQPLFTIQYSLTPIGAAMPMLFVKHEVGRSTTVVDPAVVAAAVKEMKMKRETIAQNLTARMAELLSDRSRGDKASDVASVQEGGGGSGTGDTGNAKKKKHHYHKHSSAKKAATISLPIVAVVSNVNSVGGDKASISTSAVSAKPQQLSRVLSSDGREHQTTSTGHETSTITNSTSNQKRTAAPPPSIPAAASYDDVVVTERTRQSSVDDEVIFSCFWPVDVVQKNNTNTAEISNSNSLSMSQYGGNCSDDYDVSVSKHFPEYVIDASVVGGTNNSNTVTRSVSYNDITNSTYNINNDSLYSYPPHSRSHNQLTSIHNDRLIDGTVLPLLSAAGDKILEKTRPLIESTLNNILSFKTRNNSNNTTVNGSINNNSCNTSVTSHNSGNSGYSSLTTDNHSVGTTDEGSSYSDGTEVSSHSGNGIEGTVNVNKMETVAAAGSVQHTPLTFTIAGGVPHGKVSWTVVTVPLMTRRTSSGRQNEATAAAHVTDGVDNTHNNSQEADSSSMTWPSGGLQIPLEVGGGVDITLTQRRLTQQALVCGGGRNVTQQQDEDWRAIK